VTSSIVWGEAALRLFELTGPTVVSAGAGSGKTTCLVELCVRLLAGEATGVPCDPAEIVAITFTEKAAVELEQRLRAAVAARARPGLAGGAGAGGEDERRWRKILYGLDRMAIGTIHSFAGRLLREHALEAGLDPEFDVLDEETSQAWLRDAARAALVAALDAGRAEAQVLAAAHGTGGRRAGLADVVAEIVRARSTHGEVEPIQPAPDRLEEALAARAGALEAAEALLLLRQRGANRTVSGARALAQLADVMAGLEGVDRAGPLRAEALDWMAGLAAAVRGWRPGGSPEGARERKHDLIRACEAFELCAAEVLAGPQKRELCALVAEAEARYAGRKRAARALDFDDLLVRARSLLRSDAVLRAELRARLRALLVDEYQDVNVVQEEIFQLLAGERGEGPSPWLVAVGDLKQSIYRFRGADVAVFRRVIDCFGRLDAGAEPPRARVLRLAQNHRSSPAVLELVNEVFSRCMQPLGDEARGYELAFEEEDRLVPMRAGGQRPACEILEDGEGGIAAARRPREARAIAARIQAYVSGVAGVEVRERTAAHGKEEGRRPRHGDMAILFRRLTQVGEYEHALREAGIPFRLARGGGFYQAAEVRDLGELLASLFDPQDAIAWAALLRSPMCGLGEGALFALSRLGLATLARREPEEVVRELVGLHPGAGRPWGPGPEPTSSTAPAEPSQSRFPAPVRDERGQGSTEADRLRRFLVEWRGLLAVRDRLALPDLLSRAVDAFDLEAAHLASPDGERRLVNLRKALAMAARFADGGGTARAFSDRLRMMAARPPREPEGEMETGDAVALLSVHQAKGLEWPIVFVPDLGAVQPRDARRALRDPGGALAAAFFQASSAAHHATFALEVAREEARRASAAESRRILYVALTRARDRLVLSGDSNRGGETWRGLVEAGLAGRTDLAVRIPLAEAATFAIGGRPGPQGGELPPCLAADRERSTSLPAPDVLPPSAPRPIAEAPRLAAVRLAVTELAEHARCPRRVFFARHLRLPEPVGRVDPAGDDPERATVRGTLAHAMIGEADLTAPPLERRAQLIAAAVRRGHDPQAPGVRRILAEVMRFLESTPGRRLVAAARAGTLEREVPFLLRLEGDGAPSCYLVGAVDALIEEKSAMAIIDFKYAMARAGAAERYQFQVLAYALAASRARPGRKLTASIQFLRGSCKTLDLTPSEAGLRRFARDVPRLAAAAHSGVDLSRSPAELGRTEARCRVEGCGYVSRCYPRERGSGASPKGPLQGLTHATGHENLP